MRMFLAKDVVGGITGPVDHRSDFEKWIDSGGDTIIYALIIGILIGIFLTLGYLKIQKKLEKKENEEAQANKPKNNDKDQE